jgi:hypothetical protein
VWPNPSTGGQLTVKHGEVPRSGGSIGIFAPDGRQVMRMTVPAGALQTSLDISTLPRGNYFLNMQDAGGKKSASFRKE